MKRKSAEKISVGEEDIPKDPREEFSPVIDHALKLKTEVQEFIINSPYPTKFKVRFLVGIANQFGE